jgi:hypothetical protein
MMLETETKVDGYSILKGVRFSYEMAGLAIFAIELGQGKERAEEVLHSIDSEHLQGCVAAVYHSLRKGAGL